MAPSAKRVLLSMEMLIMAVKIQERFLRHWLIVPASIISLAVLAKDKIIGQQTLVPTYKSSATLVNVPTEVHSQSGEPVRGLTQRQFRLADNGVEQSLLVEEATNVPLSLIVMMQVGGNAPTFFRDYSALDVILQTTFGNAIRQMALVMFDSRPEQIWNFPSRTDFLYFGLTHPDPGNQGAAILDALDRGVDLFRQTPPQLSTGNSPAQPRGRSRKSGKSARCSKTRRCQWCRGLQPHVPREKEACKRLRERTSEYR
jgi:hypothetical protein